MSRCFPFPPPGYEKKATPHDVNFIVKEKHKEKKHKDKKDKSKKERSEKKEKDRSEGKLKEDKNRKRKKHRDKKDKKKHKRNSAEEKTTLPSLENQNDEKLGAESKPINGVEDYRILVELGRRIGNDGGATNDRMVQKITLFNHGGPFPEAHGAVECNRDNHRMDNGLRPGVDTAGLDSSMVGDCFGKNQNEVENGMQNVEKRKERKEKTSDSKRDGREKENQDKDRKAEKKKRKEEKKRRKEEKKKRKEEKKKKKVKEKSKELISDTNFIDLHETKPLGLLNGSCDSPVNHSKRKEPELNGFLHENGIRPGNMSRPTSSPHQNRSGFGPQKSIDSAVEKRAVVMDHKPNGKLSSVQPVTENINCPTVTNNNFSTGNHMVNNGLIPVKNGTKMELCKITSNTTAIEHGVGGIPSGGPLAENGIKSAGPSYDESVDCSRPMNGFLMDGKKKHRAPTTPLASVITKETVEIPVKPPHPDSKYLSQILTVPEVEWPQNDDQEWLFGCKGFRAKKPKLESSLVEETKCVWAEAIQLESANVTALPYVIPY